MRRPEHVDKLLNLATTTKGKSMSTPRIVLIESGRYATGFTIEHDYGQSVLVTITVEGGDNPVAHTVNVNANELLAALNVIAARAARS